MEPVETLDAATGVEMKPVETPDEAMGVEMKPVETPDEAMGVEMKPVETPDEAMGIEMKPVETVDDAGAFWNALEGPDENMGAKSDTEALQKQTHAHAMADASHVYVCVWCNHACCTHVKRH